MSALQFCIDYIRDEVGDERTADEAAAELKRLQAVEARLQRLQKKYGRLLDKDMLTSVRAHDVFADLTAALERQP